MSHCRASFRLPIHRPARIWCGADPYHAVLLDLTDQGLQIESPCPVPQGARIRVAVSLAESHDIECLLEVTHAAGRRFGGRIVQISKGDQQQLSQFIDRITMLNLMGL